MVDELTFPADTTACGYRLQAHSVMVNLMMGKVVPFAITYLQCIQDLCSHFEVSLRVHYGNLGGVHTMLGYASCIGSPSSFSTTSLRESLVRTHHCQIFLDTFTMSTPKHLMDSLGASWPPGWSGSTLRPQLLWVKMPLLWDGGLPPFIAGDLQNCS